MTYSIAEPWTGVKDKPCACNRPADCPATGRPARAQVTA
jgi:hypothetical protein